MSLRSHNGVLLCKDGHLCTTCCTPNDLSLRIWYEWVEPNHDLDTGTRFLGQTVGWSYVPPGGIVYEVWTSGDNQGTGPETVECYVGQYHNIAWSGSVQIDCMAGWFELANNPAYWGNPATIRVVFNGVTQSMSISPGHQSDEATHPVAKIIVLDDFTFTLTDP